MELQEQIELNRKHQTEISHIISDEKMLGLGVQISEELWKNKTIELKNVNMLMLQKFPVADIKELVYDGNIVFVRCDELKENVFPARVNFCDTTDLDTLMKFEPYKEELDEVYVGWKDGSRKIKYDGRTLDNFLTFYPAPDTDILLEVGAYSLAASINI